MEEEQVFNAECALNRERAVSTCAMILFVGSVCHVSCLLSFEDNTEPPIELFVFKLLLCTWQNLRLC